MVKEAANDIEKLKLMDLQRRTMKFEKNSFDETNSMSEEQIFVQLNSNELNLLENDSEKTESMFNDLTDSFKYENKAQDSN